MSKSLERLAHVRREQAYLRTEEAALVAQLRRENVSWRTIAQAMGVTKQAVQKRFGRRAPDLENVPLSDPLFDPLFSQKPE